MDPGERLAGDPPAARRRPGQAFWARGSLAGLQVGRVRGSRGARESPLLVALAQHVPSESPPCVWAPGAAVNNMGTSLCSREGPGVPEVLHAG